MINVELTLNIWLAYALIGAASIVLGLRSVRSDLWEEFDLLFVGNCLLSATILIIHGWKLDPILLLQTGSDVAFLIIGKWQHIRLRYLFALLIKERNYLQKKCERLKNKNRSNVKKAVRGLNQYKSAVNKLKKNEILLYNNNKDLINYVNKLNDQNNCLLNDYKVLSLNYKLLTRDHTRLEKRWQKLEKEINELRKNGIDI